MKTLLNSLVWYSVAMYATLTFFAMAVICAVWHVSYLIQQKIKRSRQSRIYPQEYQ